MEDYAEAVFRAWRGGQAGKDNGLLLVIARGDRRSRLEVGYGLEPSLTDGEARALLHAQGPLLAHGRTADALLAIIAGVRAEVSTDPRRTAPDVDEASAQESRLQGAWTENGLRWLFFAMAVTSFVAAMVLVERIKLGLSRSFTIGVMVLPPAVFVVSAFSPQAPPVPTLLAYGAMLGGFFGGRYAITRQRRALGFICILGTALSVLFALSQDLPRPPGMVDLLFSLLTPSLCILLSPLILWRGLKQLGEGGRARHSDGGSWSVGSSSTDWSSSSSSSSSDSSSSSSSDWGGAEVPPVAAAPVIPGRALEGPAACLLRGPRAARTASCT
ncbi:YgcG family protein [Corallococcus sp. Z5C101001]|uniref:TPM domain-containing protein n=1 Tax=Corallococcus sp. Z5C101001 TaxID=2596829 RepID=UPI001C8F97DE|nr:TPM domain-containing protein [Corallococcus sp. Z5C101001]